MSLFRTVRVLRFILYYPHIPGYLHVGEHGQLGWTVKLDEATIFKDRAETAWYLAWFKKHKTRIFVHPTYVKETVPYGQSPDRKQSRQDRRHPKARGQQGRRRRAKATRPRSKPRKLR